MKHVTIAPRPAARQRRINALWKRLERDRLWLNGGYIYLASYLEKALFEMLNQPLK